MADCQFAFGAGCIIVSVRFCFQLPTSCWNICAELDVAKTGQPSPHNDISWRRIAAASKIAAEHLGLLYTDLYQLNVIILRYAAVLSAGSEPPTSVPGRLLARLLNGGREGREGREVILDDPFLLWAGREEFVDARDCARANLHALDAMTPSQRVYNVATGRSHSLDEFVEAVRFIYPKLRVLPVHEVTTGFAGFPYTRPAPSDVGAAARELGFRTMYSLEDTIRYCTETH